MLDLYITLVKAGRKQIDEVPTKFREAVRAAIEKEQRENG